MAPNDRPSTIRPTDTEAIALARRLARGARFGAMSVIDPETGHPFASRVLLGTDTDGVPVLLASMLTVHMRAIIADPRCAVLVGEPGKGDPLAWPRLTLLCDAERIARESESHDRIRDRFLRRHPKAGLYVDFGDFSFFKLVPKSASLNGGFGKAYIISSGDLIITSPLTDELNVRELHRIAELEALYPNLADRVAGFIFKEKSDNWRIAGIDAQGIDLARRDTLHRLEYGKTFHDISGLIAEYADILIGIP